MRAPAVPLTRKLLLAAVMGLLACSLMPLGSAFAEGEGGAADAPAEELQEVSTEQAGEGSGVAPMLASGLVGNPSSFVSADVALDGEPIVGSFTVDGLTFAVTEGSDVELVGVSPDWQQVTSSQEGDGSPVAPMLAPGPDGLDADSSALVLPESIAYEGIDYAVTSIGAYAFYLSGVASVELPASIAQVNDRAFRSSDVASVTVADGNPSYFSFDGALYDADQLSLLLIPEGKQGTVLLPKTAEVAPPSVFSHCSLVQAIAVEEGSAAFASENGLLYDASLTTLLRVPAGATDITIRDGCTTIVASAMEACASLATIAAPASVTSISPYLFEQEPETVMAPVAVTAVEDKTEVIPGEDDEPADTTPQLTAMVALSSADDGLPEVDAASMNLVLPENADTQPWRPVGFVTERDVDGGAAEAMGEEPLAIIAQGLSLDGPEPPTALPANAATSFATTDSKGLSFIIISSTRPDGVNCQGHFVLSQDDWGKEEIGSIFEEKFSLGTDAPTGHYELESNGAVRLQANLASGIQWYRIGVAYGNAGYSFMGWGTEDGKFSSTSMAGDLVNTTNPEVTRYAVFEPLDYTVSFDPNGGSGGPTSVEATYDSAMPTISTTKPERAGYAFMGWYDDPDYKQGTRYYTSSSSSDHLWDKAQPATLYAGWEKNPIYTVTIQSDAGAGGTQELYLWYGKGWYDTSNPSDTTTPIATISFPSNPGYSPTGCWNSLTSSNKNQYVDADGNITARVDVITSNATWHVGWSANTITIKWDSDGGSAVDATSATYSSEATVPIPSNNPTKAGYSFNGWYTSSENDKETVGEAVTADTPLPTSNVTYYAHWATAITLHANGTGARIGLVTDSDLNLPDDAGDVFELKARANSLIAYPSGGPFYFTAEGYTAVSGLMQPCVFVSRPGYAFLGWSYEENGPAETSTISRSDWTAPEGVQGITLYAQWATAITLHANGTGARIGLVTDSDLNLPDDAGDVFELKARANSLIAYPSGGPFYFTAEGYTAVSGLMQPCVFVSRPGYAFLGWSYEENGPAETSTISRSDWTAPEGVQGITLYAQWTPIVSADVPIEVTAEVDLLGIEDQVPATGYIESRCGAPLAVEQVSFTALAGAAELFGEANTASVSLQALALEGDASWDASVPTFSFPLSANATESDASKLAAFRMEGYEDHIPIGYRFAIPDDVLSSIDPARFERVATPVCSVYYTVALAS